MNKILSTRISVAIVSVCVVMMITGWVACKKPFNPESIAGVSSALIVEGVLNSSGETNIYLSRTLDLDDKVAIRPELKATVRVLSESNTAISLAEQGSGRYSVAQLNLNTAQKYRLNIKTADGKEYMSEPLVVKPTPAIDSVNWVRGANGVDIFVNTHDAKNKTRYYQWEYEEDWELRSIGYSRFKLIPGTIPRGPQWQLVSRDAQELPLMFTCYKKQRSTNILISSTAKLSSDVVSNFPLVAIQNGSDRLSVRYSLLVKQYAIDFQNFEYLSMMKRNSEQLGSLFDAQPTELIGNIRNVSDPGEVVIGYIGIASVLQKRIFIERADVLGWPFTLFCKDLNVPKDSLEYYFGPGSGNLIGDTGEENQQGQLLTYRGTTEACLDCRTRGGNNNKPVFW